MKAAEKKPRLASDWIAKRMQDPKFREAYEAMEPEYALARGIIEARINKGLSQSELAKRMGTTQPMIARMEGGRQSPSTATLLKFAKATGTRLHISFVDTAR